MSCLLAKSDAASLTQAFSVHRPAPIKHRPGRRGRARSRARSAALPRVQEISLGTRGGQCSRTRVGRTGGKELVSTLPYWVPRARTRARMTMRRIGELMTAGAGFSSENKVHTNFSHGVRVYRVTTFTGTFTESSEVAFLCVGPGKWRTPLAIALAMSMEPALRQHLRSTTCSAVTASLRA